MLSIRKVVTIAPSPPRIIRVLSMSKINIRIKATHKLSSFFKDLFGTLDLNILFSERKKLLKIFELTIAKLIEEKNEENRKIILSVLEETHEKIDKLNLKIHALLYEIPISEKDIRDWKEEIIKVIDYIYNAQLNKVEYPSYINEFLNLKISRLANLREAINHHINELKRKVEEIQQELNNINVKYSVGLIDEASYKFFKESIGEMIKTSIEEIEYLKNYNEQLTIQKGNEEYQEKIKTLKEKIISKDIDKLLV